MEWTKTSELTKRLIKLEPKSFFNIISEHPSSILSSSTGIEDILILLMEVDQASFLKMAVELKSSEYGNIMHCVANQNMINFANNLIEKIQNHYEAQTVAKLMFSRNVAENSPMMVMISKMTMRNRNWSNEDKDKIISIWSACINDQVFQEIERDIMTEYWSIDILLPNKQKQTILHLCIQSKMFELFSMICSSKYVDDTKLFDIFDDSNSTPLVQIFDEAFLKTVLSQHLEKKFKLETQKIVLWHVCKNNFDEVFHFVKESMPQEEFLVIIKLTDDDSNNCSMIAAKEASDMVLMSLLSTLVYSTNKREDKDEFIHHKNKWGDTLLKIIISHGDTLSMHREVMIKVCFIYNSFSFLSAISYILKKIF